MQLKYLGHSSFLIKSKDAKVVTDPFDPKAVGLKFPKQEADIVTMSHGHADHNHSAGVSAEALVVDWPGEYEKMGVRITGYSTFHDKEKGAQRGENIIYKIEADDISILHCGDLGHTLTDDLVEEIGDVDILLIPVGGHYTINSAEALSVVHKIEPAIVIPMHYNHEGLDQKAVGELTGLDEFIKVYGSAPAETLDVLNMKKDDVPEETKLILLKISN
ncbi:MAG: MBL fold metallo-hydrolase [Microgenomates group bacterium]